MAECEVCAGELTAAAYECRECDSVTCRSHRAPDRHDCPAGPHAVPDYRILDPESVSNTDDERDPADGPAGTAASVVLGAFEGVAVVVTLLFKGGMILVSLTIVLVFLMLVLMMGASATASAVSGTVVDLVVGLVGGVALIGGGYALLRVASSRTADGRPAVVVSARRLRNRSTATLYAVWYRVRTSLTGSRPEGGGTVTFSGRVVEPAEPLRSPLEDVPSVLYAYRVDGFDDRTDAQFGTASGPKWPDLAVRVAVEPFAVETGGRELLVDPRPWDPETEDRPVSGDHPSEWPGAALEYSATVDRMSTLEDLEGEFGERIREAVERRTGRVPGEEVYLAITVRRLEPDEEVELLGWSVGNREHLEPDVVNVSGVEYPFRLSLR